MRLNKILAHLALFALVPFLPMCGPGAIAFCDAACDCRGCSDRDYDECVDDFDIDVRRADRLGCGDLFDDYANCVVSGDGCRGTDYDHDCDVEKKRYNNCMD